MEHIAKQIAELKHSYLKHREQEVLDTLDRICLRANQERDFLSFLVENARSDYEWAVLWRHAFQLDVPVDSPPITVLRFLTDSFVRKDAYIEIKGLFTARVSMDFDPLQGRYAFTRHYFKEWVGPELLDLASSLKEPEKSSCFANLLQSIQQVVSDAYLEQRGHYLREYELPTPWSSLNGGE